MREKADARPETGAQGSSAAETGSAAVDPAETELPALTLAPDRQAVLRAWLSEPRYAAERGALEATVAAARAGDEVARAELEDAFARDLPIGTGGRRGPVGPGPNRINELVIRETAQGVALALAEEDLPRKVAVVYDTRRHSRALAHVVAAQLAAAGAEVVLVDAPRPTPQLSFWCRRWGCGAGVVITASHNPPGDNGIKIYGPDGAQVIGARDRRLTLAIQRAAAAPLPAIPGDAAEVAAPGVRRLDPDADPGACDGPYHAWVLAQGVYPAAAKADLRVVFTPLHGVGHTSVEPVLRARGIGVETVSAQRDPDGGNFSTVASANPESPASMAMAIELAERSGADLVLATDPDADRLGAAARDAEGRFEAIDGNRLGVLLLDHVLRHGAPPPAGWVITTTVTTPLVAALARAAGLECVDDLLVGFKHHAAMVAEAADRPLVFACEESHGYVRGTEVRDKDGAVAALLLAECAAECKARGETLFDRLASVWSRLGYHREHTTSIYAHGAAGREAIASLMAAWRAEPPRAFGGLAVQHFEDREAPRATGSRTRDLPGDLLSFELAGGALACRVVVRPSGTEPKAKLYVLARAAADAGLSLDEQRAEVDRVVEQIAADVAARAEQIMGRGAEGAAP